MSLNRAVSLPAALILTSVAITGCTKGADKADGNQVAITATDTSCAVATTQFASGTVSFAVTNKGSRMTEVYVYGEQDEKYTRIVAEVENIGPGTSRDMSATLGAGEYEIACKPGQEGDGIRTKITVTGEQASTSAAAYDGQVRIELEDNALKGADGLTAKAGDKVEFSFENSGPDERELQIFDPAGKVAGEIPTAAGKTAETIVELATPGAWTLKVEDTALKATLTVS